MGQELVLSKVFSLLSIEKNKYYFTVLAHD